MSRYSQSDTEIKVSGNGLGFLPCLALVFITLKLTNYIQWSWFWVLSPLWIPTIIVFFIIIAWLIALKFIK